MSSVSLSFWCRAALAVVVAFSGSCASLLSNATSERKKQSSDSLTGGGKLALTAFRSTVVAAVRQPVTTAKIGIANLWNRPRGFISDNLPTNLTVLPAPAGPPGSREFEERLDKDHFPRAELGKLTWLVDGPGFFPELDRRIAAARSSIHIQVFIFDNDDVAVRYADTLKRRSAEVPVHVLFDDIGTTFAHTEAPDTPRPNGFAPPADMHDYMQNDSKVRVRRVLDPWLACDHTKLLVFDNSSAIVGGMNIGREYFSEWHDLMVKVDGPVVNSLGREFNRAWRKAGPWGDFALLRKPEGHHQAPAAYAGGIPIRVFRTDPAESRYDILNATLLAITSARKRVWIETPYLAHDGIIAACVAAARRGVDVRVIIPSSGDSQIMTQGNLSTAGVLIRAGVEILAYPGMTHVKATICDDWACVGSANMDTLSMRINRELNLAFSDPKTVRALEKTVFAPDFRRSRKLGLSETITPTAGLAEILADQL